VCTIMYCIYQYIHSCPIYWCTVSVLNNCIIIITSVVCYFLLIFSYFLLLYSLLLTVAFTHTYLRAYTIEPSPSREANRFSVRQEIPLILWNPEVRFPIYKCRHLLHTFLLFSNLVVVLWYSSQHQSVYVNKRCKYVFVVD